MVLALTDIWIHRKWHQPFLPQYQWQSLWPLWACPTADIYSSSPFLSTPRWWREGTFHQNRQSRSISQSVGDDSWRGGACRHGLQVPRRIGSSHVRKKVRVAAQLVDVKAILLLVSQTAADKRLQRTRQKIRPWFPLVVDRYIVKADISADIWHFSNICIGR